MINIFKREPILRKLIGICLIGVMLVFCVFAVFQYNNLKNIYLEQSKVNQRIVASMVEKYPEDEVDIVKIINSSSDSKEEIGKSILAKYGYDESYMMSKDDNFKHHLRNFMLSDICIFIALIIVIGVIASVFINYIFNRLLKLSNYIEDIVDGRYCVDEDFNEEGIFSRIYSDLNKLSRSLTMKINDLDKEKESIKELVTDISHQLKTPLASLNLYNTLLLEEDLHEEEELEFLKTNEMSINKLHNLIDSLVNISRLEANMINIKREDKSIKNTLQNAINSARVKASLKNISINLEDFEDEIIPHDSKWTEESIFNVIENGVKYTPDNGEINISVSQTPNFVRIDIQDNGIGIDKSEFNNIFKRFYRNEEVEDVEGSGVGLYLSRKILELQGGNIIVSSQKGKGSKFSLFLTKL